MKYEPYMQTVTVQITDKNALKALHALEDKQFIRILENSHIDSPALPGQTLSLSAFKQWIGAAENSPSIDLKDAKEKWAAKRKQLLPLTK
jgi:hypothetical protein